MPITFRRKDNLRGSAAEERIGIAIRLGFGKLGDFIVPSLKKRAPKDRRKFERSIRYRLSGRGLKTRMLIFASAQHAEYIEKGREKGKPPPPNVLLAWVRRKGLGSSASSVKTRRAISAGTRRTFNRKEGKRRTAGQSLLQNQKSIAFLIGRKIAREGLPSNTRFKPSHGLWLFRDLKSDYSSQVSATITRVQGLVAQQLNS